MDKLLKLYSEQSAREPPLKKRASADSGNVARNSNSAPYDTNREYIERNIVGVIFEGNEGYANSVTHYYHFLFAAFYPLLEFHLSAQNRYNGYRILTDVGPMKHTLTELPLNIVELAGPIHSLTRANESQSQLKIAMPAYDSFVDGLYGDELTPMLSLSSIRNVNRFLAVNLPRYLSCVPIADVILIERAQDKYYQSVEVEQKHKISGSTIRCIKNHTQLVEALSSKFGSRFMTVVLERSSIYYQFQLFSQAKVVIGQHGAALSNIVFMISSSSPPSAPTTSTSRTSSSSSSSSSIDDVDMQLNRVGKALIEIIPPADFVKVSQFKHGARSHFKNLSSHLGIPYFPVNQENDFSDVNILEVTTRTEECLRSIDQSTHS